MNKFKLSALFLGLIFPYILIGQFSGFDLSKYKLPDIKTNRLDLNFDLTNRGNKDMDLISEVDTSETRQNNFLSSLDLYYYHYRNSEKYQGDLVVNVDISPQFTTRNQNEYITKSNYLKSRIIISSTNSFFNKNLNFLRVDPYLSLTTENSRSQQGEDGSPSMESNTDAFVTNFSIPISIGHGRIEPVEDVRLAIYILEELNRAGKISVLPTDNVIIDMAKEISKIKRKRFFDSRIKKIKELQVIDSFLVANDLISSNDINYYSVLRDQWDYASAPARESGFAISAGFDNNVSFSKIYLESIFTGVDTLKHITDRNIYDLGAFINIRYAKPINLYWQVSGFLTTSYNLEFTRDPNHKNSPEENFKANIFRTDLNFSLQYLPNSRTSFKLYMQGSYNHSQGERTRVIIDPIDYMLKNNQLTISPGLDFYYYISPQLRIQLNSAIKLFNINSLEKNMTTMAKQDVIHNSNQNATTIKLIYSFF